MLDLNSMMSDMNAAMENPEAFEQPKGEKFKADERFYKISKGKDGNGSVKIRFIPSFNNEKTKLNTFITRAVHGVTQYKTIGGEKKKRFINEICPKMVSKERECPICDHAWDNYNRLIDSDEKAAKEFPKAFASKSKYISNIQIIEDSENPSNEGKIFLFEYGDQIQKLIKAQSQPSAEEIKDKGMTPFNAWDLMKGKDFRLKLKDGKHTANGFPSWEESFFVTDASSHVEDMKAMEALLNEAIILDEFIDDTHVNSLEKIVASLNYVLYKDPKKKEESKEETKTKESTLSEAESMPEEMAIPDFKAEVKEEPKPEVKKEETAQAVDSEDFFAQFN